MELIIAVTLYFLALGCVLYGNYKISLMNKRYDSDAARWYKEMTEKDGD